MDILFFIAWLLMAGEITLPVCLWGGAVSLLMGWFCRRVLDYHPHMGKLARRSGALLSYLWYLLREMMKAGLVVMQLIYTKGERMEPRLIWFDTTLKDERAQAVLADSITLTAGTITVSARDGRFCVHALDASLAEDIQDCEFQRRLEKLEA